MENTIIKQRLNLYQLNSANEEQDALKEILQEIVLYSLSNTDFFQQALFLGGTSLRILYQLPRFSEDLDFQLNSPNENFKWEKYFKKITQACELFGVEPEVIDRSKVSSNVKKMFVKDNSIGKLLELKFHHHTRQKLRIKLEIDINPPQGSQKEANYLTFPAAHSVISVDKATNFAGKCHALLCRKYVKGRDWFDFLWYVDNKVQINWDYLKNSLQQNGQWQNQNIIVNKQWLHNELKLKILSLDWNAVREDVSRFILNASENFLDAWDKDLFMRQLDMLTKYL